MAMTELEAYEYLKEHIKTTTYSLTKPVIEGLVGVSVEEIEKDAHWDSSNKYLKEGEAIYPTYMWQWPIKLSVLDVEAVYCGLKNLKDDFKVAGDRWNDAALMVAKTGFVGGFGVDNDPHGLFKKGAVIKITIPQVTLTALVPVKTESGLEGVDNVFCVMLVGAISHLIPKEVV